MEYNEILKLVIEFLLIGSLGFLVKFLLGRVSVKLDEVLKNQQNQEVTTAEIKKDVEVLLSKDKETSDNVKTLQKRVGNLEIKVSELVEFKRQSTS